MHLRRLTPVIISGLCLWTLLLAGCAAETQTTTENQRYSNTEVPYRPGFGTFVKGFWNMLTSDNKEGVPTKPIPVIPITHQQLVNETQDVVYRLGHSTVLMKLGSQWILTDPMFSERASPMQWVGPKRFHPVPIQIKDLPPIDVVLISHSHYDHLDEASVKALIPKVGQFLVPEKIDQILLGWGVPKDKVHRFKWWQSTQIGTTTFVFTPAQHFSGRSMFDQNKTLWGGWVIKGQQHRLYYSGDSGYFHGFKKIGDQYGPFDVALLEDGQYSHNWPVIHMFPKQVVQASLDLRAKVLLPVHNSTFQLSDHAWYAPLKDTLAASQKRGVTMIAPEFGQRYEIGKPLPIQQWWNPMPMAHTI
ncbi:MBL fold metallo-hydrolase [Celerinatantimonas sp. YJH-8]|uniref:MBL fold metallo-hydrolase n=1 Tax=Celerinatantimonas sp. YJH-8 TaxID=3228714 RepID=UPI0038BEB1F1